MDEYQFEMAERLAQAQRQAALDSAAHNAAPERHPGFNGSRCVECDDAIPAQRLAMGKVRCVSCQTHIETARRR